MGVFDRGRGQTSKQIEDFMAKHEGVEAYIEPPTVNFKLSLLLVARSGDWTRFPIADRGQARSICKKVGIPIYDAAIVGYPDRMRGVKGSPAPEAPSPDELEAWFTSGEAPEPGGPQ